MHKIVFVANQYFPNVVGGAELTLQILAEALSQRGTEVVVISLSPTAFDSHDEVNGIRVHRVAVRNSYYPFGAERSAAKRFLWHWRDVYNRSMAAQVGRILDAERPDVVSTHNLGGFSVAVWAQAKSRGMPILHTLHDYYLLCPRTSMFRGGANCRRQCTLCWMFSIPKKIASRKVDSVVGVSQFVLGAHLRHGLFANARATVIYNARPPKAEDKRSLPNRQNGVLRIGFIGRIEEQKGIEVLLQAVVQLPRGAWQLRVGGRAPSSAYLAKLRTRYPQTEVEYLGYVAQADFFPTLDVLVVPSVWNEPLGVVVFEAMGYGVPVIGSRVGGIPEIIEGSGAGWLFDSGNVRQLTALLREAINAPQSLASMREACIERAQFFTPERQVTQFLTFLGRRTLLPASRQIDSGPSG
jgi:glycosyltransferase involved in cell wall biosynthesis